mgnify:CR=1 FL=1
MKYKIVLLIVSFFNVSLVCSYEGSEIMEIKPIKRSIYRESGIFHNGIKENFNTLEGLRHSGKKINSYERIVFDFSTGEIPQIYAHINESSGKLQIDFLRTKLSKDLKPVFKSHRVKEINFFPLADSILSAELLLKKNTYIEIFYLTKPARLVVDFKN